MFRELESVPGVYTLEASFAGSKDGLVFTPEVLKSIGRDLCRALIPYCGLETAPGLGNLSGSEFKDKALAELKNNQELLYSGDRDSSDCSGSDSAPSDDNLPDSLLNAIVR